MLPIDDADLHAFRTLPWLMIGSRHAASDAWPREIPWKFKLLLTRNVWTFFYMVGIARL